MNRFAAWRLILYKEISPKNNIHQPALFIEYWHTLGTQLCHLGLNVIFRIPDGCIYFSMVKNTFHRLAKIHIPNNRPLYIADSEQSQKRVISENKQYFYPNTIHLFH